jgi:pimeloyl-ACP methyl ester carboxylesterase
LEQGFVRVPGAEVHYIEAGHGPPLVLVHGLAASWRWWQPVLDTFTSRYRVIAFDLPSFGLTRANKRFSLKSAGHFVCQVMSALGLDRADLIGHSLGGRVCMDVAASCPERVGRLVLVSTVGIPWRKPYPMIGLDLLREGRVNLPKYPDLVREDARRVRFLELALATFETIADDFRHNLGRIRAPTKIIWGGRDVLTPPDFGRVLSEEIPNADLTIIDEAGHTPMWDAPEDFTELALSFLSDGVRGRTATRAPGRPSERSTPEPASIFAA